MNKDHIESNYNQIFRFFIFISCIYGTTDYCLPKEVVDLQKTLYGSKYIYLTNICLYLTVLCLIMGYMVRYKEMSFIKNIYKHSITVMLPLNGLVSILFWVLYSIDPTLLRDKDLYCQGVRISLFTDLCVHLFPFLSLINEIRGLKITRHRSHLKFYVYFTILYYIVCLYFSKLNGIWVYPIMGKINTFYRVFLFGVSTLIALGLYEAMIHILINKS
ncbi:hypothetical protein P3W45_001135 [Vairimorpha bombi]